MASPASDRETKDPFLTYKFLVEIDGLIVAGFTEVSGLSIQTEVETVKEGGVNDLEYKLPVRTKCGDITLKRGLMEKSELWDWYKKVVEGTIVRKHGSIHLMNHVGERKVSWDFINAYPVKWDCPAFNASSSTVAVETFVLAPEKLTKKT